MAAKPERMRIRLSDKESFQEIRTILAYESSVRGLTIGQAVSELIQEAVDTSSYPEEVRARLREIADDSTRRAIEKSLGMSREDDRENGREERA